MKCFGLAVAVAGAICATQGWAEEPTRPQPAHTNVPYSSHQRTVLDFWQAKSPVPTPVVVFIHGGGFTSGDKSKANAKLIQRCLDRKVSYAAINYRYVTEVPIQDVLRDCGRAVQFLRHKSEDWNIDKERLAAHGGSAGAGASLWLAFHPDLADPTSVDLVLRESTRLRAAGASACQASYDIARWQELFGNEIVEKYSPQSQWPAFYGLKSVDEMLSEAGQKVRADVDLLGLIDQGDCPVWLGSRHSDGEVQDRGHLVHHPSHSVAVRNRCEAVGLPAVLRRGQDAFAEGDLLDFLFTHLDVAPATP